MIHVSGTLASTGRAVTTRGRPVAPVPPVRSRTERRLLDAADTADRRAQALLARALSVRAESAACLRREAAAEMARSERCRREAALTATRHARDGGRADPSTEETP